jgi:uncharacterized protein
MITASPAAPREDVPLPAFRYHPDPLASGSIVESASVCRCCDQHRGYVYAPAVYAVEELAGALCPWCIADGTAHRRFDATFVDSEAFDAELPDEVVQQITTRTPGFANWQGEHWPACCDDATAFLEPAGIADIRARYRELEMQILNHIIYDLGISGGAASRLLESLGRDQSPTAFTFRCLHCGQLHFYIDRT